MKKAKRILVGILCIITILALVFAGKMRMTHSVKVDDSSWNTNYRFIFVHGLSGWGSYDQTNRFIKYWGMFSGDTLKSLNKNGFDCYAASVSPEGSAWDRACELYAQLTGSVTDYGVAHSAEHDHARFGTDYSDKPLIPTWDSRNKINLLGHSFGGATVRLLSDLMADGSEAEQIATSTDNISPLFVGGKGDWIYSITTLAAPHNGTSVYEALDAEAQKASEPPKSDGGGTDGIDNAAYDLHIDNALALNQTQETQAGIYYFSYPCNVTAPNEEGNFVPDSAITENMFMERSTLMGKFIGKTAGDFTIDASWLPNDGLVNTISAMAPLYAPAKEYEPGKTDRGIWNVMPTVNSDHMSFMGGMFKTIDQSQFYADHLSLINSLPY